MPFAAVQQLLCRSRQRHASRKALIIGGTDMQNHQALCDQTPILGAQTQPSSLLHWSKLLIRQLRRDGVFALITDLMGHCLAGLTIGGMLLVGVYLFLSQLAEYGW
jgi:hypothetical protein